MVPDGQGCEERGASSPHFPFIEEDKRGFMERQGDSERQGETRVSRFRRAPRTKLFVGFSQALALHLFKLLIFNLEFE